MKLNFPYLAARHKFIISALFLIFCACGKNEPLPDYAFLSGEIVNPSLPYVVIFHHDEPLDTLKLNNRNRFSYKIENPEGDFYTVQHPPKKQILFIAPGDSLLFRANTLAFEESIHFSGKGMERNNFMANMFLEDENTAQLLLKFQKFTPAVFITKADSIKAERLNTFQKIAKKSEFSEDFEEIAEKIILYENYDLRERYYYLVQKYAPQNLKEFPEDFFDYRNIADFNDTSLQYNPSYRRFINTYLINYSLTHCANAADCKDLTAFQNVITRLGEIAELLQVPELRNYFLEKIAVRGIIMARNRTEIIGLLKLLQKLDLPAQKLEEMKQLGSIQLGFLPGTSLTAIPLLNMKGENLVLGDILKRPSVIFIWSVYNQDHVEEHRLINQFEEKYPEIDFIGVNVDVNEEPLWRMAIRENKYRVNREYQLRDTGVEEKFLQHYLDKLIFVSPDGKVVKGDTYLTASDFESHLLKFLNE